MNEILSNDIRWGDQASLVGPTTIGFTKVNGTVSGQCVRANLKRSTTWLVQATVAVDPAFAAGEASTYIIAMRTIFGVGSAKTTIVDLFTLTPPYAGLLGQVPTLFNQGALPAKDIQIDFFLTDCNNTAAGTHNFIVAAFASPLVVEPDMFFAMVDEAGAEAAEGRSSGSVSLTAEEWARRPIARGPRGGGGGF